MKKLITLIALVSLSLVVHAETNTVTEIDAWIQRSLTDAEVRFQDYLTPAVALIGGERVNVLVCRAYLEIDPALLGTPVPQAAVDIIHTDGSVTNLVLSDFTLGMDILARSVIIALSANEKLNGVSRHLPTSAEHVATWMVYLNAFGFIDADLLTAQQRLELLPEVK